MTEFRVTMIQSVQLHFVRLAPSLVEDRTARAQSELRQEASVDVSELPAVLVTGVLDLYKRPDSVTQVTAWTRSFLVSNIFRKTADTSEPADSGRHT